MADPPILDDGAAIGWRHHGGEWFKASKRLLAFIAEAGALGG